MKTIRIGNDIAITWAIVRNGKPEDFRAKTLSLFIYSRYGKESVKSFAVNGNSLRFAFLGKSQRYAGDYGLLLVVNEGADGMFSVDLDRAFCLTEHTDCGCTGVISLSSDIAVPANGLSAYELAVINGYKGTEQEWLQSLVQPAKDAAAEAFKAAGAANDAAKSAIDTDNAIKKAETGRVTAEQGRVSAEEGRTDAESKRVVVESSRVTAETGRVKAEQGRESAEVSRVKDEQGRASAEEGRADAESKRIIAESSRVAAEDSRVSVEQSRVASEASRVAAEQGRILAESTRVTAENQRQTDTANAITAVKSETSSAVSAMNANASAVLTKVQTDTQAAIDANNSATTDAVNKATASTTAANDAAIKADAAAIKANDAAGNIGINGYPEFSSIESYAAGDVVRYNGRLFRFTAAHPAGEWIGTDVEQTSMNDILSDEVHQIGCQVSELGKLQNWSDGFLVVNGTISIREWCAVSDFIDCHTGDNVVWKWGNTYPPNQVFLVCYDDQKNVLSAYAARKEDGDGTFRNLIILIEKCSFVRFSFIKADRNSCYLSINGGKAYVPQDNGRIVVLEQKVGDTSQLSTLAKTDLVSAINELKEQLSRLSAATVPALMSVRQDVDGLISDMGGVNNSELPLLCGQPPILFGHGAPAKGSVPDNWRQYDPITGDGYDWNGQPSALGQQYINVDASPGGLYIAVREDKENELKWLNI